MEIVVEESSVVVQDESVSVKISLTSPLLRESPEGAKSSDMETEGSGDAAQLPREPCLKVISLYIYHSLC